MAHHNQYSKLLLGFFDECPKTVFAALAVSRELLVNGENSEAVEAGLLSEWQSLYENGIVPQKPPKQIKK